MDNSIFRNNQKEQPKPILDENILFLDIETTGLKPETSKITIIGTLTNSGIRQFYDDEEQEILKSFLNFMEDMKFNELITYNGNSFDIPFLQTRMKDHNVTVPLPLRHIDLYEIRKSEIQIQKEENGTRGYTSATQSITCEKYGIYVPRNTSGEYMAKLFSKPSHKITPNDVCDLLHHNATDLFALSSLYYKMKEFKTIGDPVEAFL